MQIEYKGKNQQLKNLKKELSPRVTMASVLREELTKLPVEKDR